MPPKNEPLPRNIPHDINIELLLSYYPQGTFKVIFDGLNKRNTYHDLVNLVEGDDNTFELTIGRNSLYHVLPEYMFHPIDRFKDIIKTGNPEDFEREYNLEKREAETAKSFFAPLDLLLLTLRKEIRERISDYIDSNKVVIDMIGDKLSASQKQNRFIRQILHFLPYCKDIRGNKTILTILLRKVFLKENLLIEVNHNDCSFTEEEPRYSNRLSGTVGSVYLGNEFQETVITYTIHYWSDKECDENFPVFIKETEELQDFIQDYFIGLDEIIRLEIVKSEGPLHLYDQDNHYYLNYNTYL